MPDLPPATGIYRGQISAEFVVNKSGRTSNITVNASDLNLASERVNRQAVEAYARDSLAARKFSPRPEPCKVTFSAWVN
jgi:hypothetical protein